MQTIILASPGVNFPAICAKTYAFFGLLPIIRSIKIGLTRMIDRKMDQKILIQRIEQVDIPAIEILYSRAFTDEDLFPLVIALLEDEQNMRVLCAVNDGFIIGHIAFTKCHAMPKNIPLSLLGPLAVLPDWQR